MLKGAVYSVAVVVTMAAGFTSEANAAQCASIISAGKNCVSARCTKVGVCGGPIWFRTDGCLKWMCEKIQRPPKFPKPR